MAFKKDPSQIIRKDGNKCFVEVMNSAFSIDKVLFRFYTYDMSSQPGSRLSNGVQIYLSFEEFYRICHDITVTRSLLLEIQKLAQDAAAQGKQYAPTKTLYMGGTPASTLARSGQSRPDNMSLSRQLKIQAGTKYPVLLVAESGPGEQDAKGLIVPRYQSPECKVTIPFTYEAIKELFLIAKAHLDAYLASQYTYMAFHPEEQESQRNENGGQRYNQSSNGYQQKPQYSNYQSRPQQPATPVAQATPQRANSYQQSPPQTASQPTINYQQRPVQASPQQTNNYQQRPVQATSQQSAPQQANYQQRPVQTTSQQANSYQQRPTQAVSGYQQTVAQPTNSYQPKSAQQYSSQAAQNTASHSQAQYQANQILDYDIPPEITDEELEFFQTMNY